MHSTYTSTSSESALYTARVLRRSIFWAFALFLVAVVTVFADAPLVPAGSVPAPATGGAAAGAAGGLTGQAGGGWTSMMFPLAMIAVLYFLMIRPQAKKAKEHKEMLGTMKAGDEVITNSGFIGRISGMNEKVVTLELADKVSVKMLKSQVAYIKKGELKDLEVR